MFSSKKLWSYNLERNFFMDGKYNGKSRFMKIAHTKGR
jgi:hypothetical protein